MGLRILYGVQGTGNGHISRSREIVRNLKTDGHDVQVIVSGRDPALLWEMEVFEPFVALEGLTFSTKRGRLQYVKTARRLPPLKARGKRKALRGWWDCPPRVGAPRPALGNIQSSRQATRA